MMKRIAIVEDNRNDSELIRRALEGAGYSCAQFFTKESAIEGLVGQKFDALVLDIELRPHEHGGIEILGQLLAAQTKIPTLVVSGQAEYLILKNIVKGLGAWDYLQKNYNDHSELLDAIESLLEEFTDETLCDDQLVIRADGVSDAEVYWKGHKLFLPRTNLKILHLLYRNKDSVVPHKVLYSLCKSGKNIENLRNHIRALKDSFESVDEDFDRIINVPARGYMWTQK